MTKRRAERLIGYEIRRIPEGESDFRYGAFSGEELLAEAQHRKEGIALTLLVNRVYQIIAARCSSSTDEGARAVVAPASCRSITGSSDRMEGHTGRRIWSRSADTVTG